MWSSVEYNYVIEYCAELMLVSSRCGLLNFVLCPPFTRLHHLSLIFVFPFFFYFLFFVWALFTCLWQSLTNVERWNENIQFVIFIFMQSSVWCLCTYVLFRICVETNLVDFKEFCGLTMCVQNNLEVDWSLFSAFVILYGWLGWTHQQTN